jgi:F-type H+-transporting ATPase subunit epsilon
MADAKASNKTFDFELVSPEAKLISEPAWQAVVPGEEGAFTVLAGHSSLVASIKPGVVQVWTQGADKPQRIFISGGLADVTGANLTVLAEEAVNVDALDKTSIEESIKNIEDDLKLAERDKAKKARLQKDLVIARAQMAAIDA